MLNHFYVARTIRTCEAVITQILYGRVSKGFHTYADQLLDVESQSGSLFCGMCDDFVWDPTLEALRLQKFGTGTFSSELPILRPNFC